MWKAKFPLSCNVQTICLALVLDKKNANCSLMIFDGSLYRLFITIHFTDSKSDEPLHRVCMHLSDYEISSQTLINRKFDCQRSPRAF